MYVDTDIFYAVIKADDRHKEKAKKIIETKEKKYTSIITLLELEILLKREISDMLSQKIYEIFKQNFKAIKIKQLNEKIFRKSLELREKNGLGIFDSLHAATAMDFDKRIASTDTIYDRIDGLARII